MLLSLLVWKGLTGERAQKLFDGAEAQSSGEGKKIRETRHAQATEIGLDRAWWETRGLGQLAVSHFWPIVYKLTESRRKGRANARGLARIICLQAHSPVSPFRSWFDPAK